MSHTTKPLQKSKPGSDLDLSDLLLGSHVELIHVITDEVVFGVVRRPWHDPETGNSGCVLIRTDEHGNRWASEHMHLDNDDYNVRKIDGHVV